MEGIYVAMQGYGRHEVIIESPSHKLHWFLQIRPRLRTQAGFEMGSGICINPSLSEADADLLRQGGP